MKLYWRYKKDGKWTWKAADVLSPIPDKKNWAYVYVGDEEE